ncbi:MAG: hypothetical protein R6V06_01105 [Kiritimatiellia bacterium]
MKRKVIIIGAGGFGKEVAWILRRSGDAGSELEVQGFCDDDAAKAEGVKDLAPFLGTVEEVVSRFPGCAYHCAIGNNRIRRDLMQRLDAAGLKAVSVVDFSSVVADDAVVSPGCYIGVHSVVSAGTRVGRGVIINHNVSVGHDAAIKDYAQVCPGVSISGGCDLGEGALLGSNSCTLPVKRMGAWSVLGAGGVLLTDLEDGGSRVRLR